MTHIIMLYLSTLPGVIYGLFSFVFNFHPDPLSFWPKFFFLYHVNLLNWICGYHWTLSFETVQFYTKKMTVLLMLLSIWASITYLDGQLLLAQRLLAALYLIQLRCDFNADITYFISPYVKMARVVMTFFSIFHLLWVL